MSKNITTYGNTEYYKVDESQQVQPGLITYGAKEYIYPVGDKEYKVSSEDCFAVVELNKASAKRNFDHSKFGQQAVESIKNYCTNQPDAQKEPKKASSNSDNYSYSYSYNDSDSESYNEDELDIDSEDKSYRKGGSTLLTASLNKNGLIIGNLGDSAIYATYKDTVIKLTLDMAAGSERYETAVKDLGGRISHKGRLNADLEPFGALGNMDLIDKGLITTPEVYNFTKGSRYTKKLEECLKKKYPNDKIDFVDLIQKGDIRIIAATDFLADGKTKNPDFYDYHIDLPSKLKVAHGRVLANQEDPKVTFKENRNVIKHCYERQLVFNPTKETFDTWKKMSRERTDDATICQLPIGKEKSTFVTVADSHGKAYSSRMAEKICSKGFIENILGNIDKGEKKGFWASCCPSKSTHTRERTAHKKGTLRERDLRGAFSASMSDSGSMSQSGSMSESDWFSSSLNASLDISANDQKRSR